MVSYGSWQAPHLAMAVIPNLWQEDPRRAKFGALSPELGWGERNRNQFQIGDAYISLKQGPEKRYVKINSNDETYQRIVSHPLFHPNVG